MPKKELWKKLLIKINSTKKTYPSDMFIVIYRQDLVKYFNTSWPTIDFYVLILVKAGYIRKVNPGVYIKIKNVPEDIPMKKFIRNYKGKMLWTEQVLTFYNLYQDFDGE